eukprot:TRINITY_DN26656_c0_g9_i1.p1 TRINITY_DN26656_c0_g9~~TRINITY_DN26656_c0_g9_i1.p1  ORF type:complete len:714 (+),score=100.03 TRINITY_DN26656_c0_g9_i1:49-2190(+)
MGETVMSHSPHPKCVLGSPRRSGLVSSMLKRRGPAGPPSRKARVGFGGNLTIPRSRGGRCEQDPCVLGNLVPPPEPAVDSVLPAQASEPEVGNVLPAQEPDVMPAQTPEPEGDKAQAQNSEGCKVLPAQAPEPATVDPLVRRRLNGKRHVLLVTRCLKFRLRAKTPPKIAVAQHRQAKAEAAKETRGTAEENQRARYKRGKAQKSCGDPQRVEERERAQQLLGTSLESREALKGAEECGRSKRKQEHAFRNDGVPEDAEGSDSEPHTQAKAVKSSKRARQRQSKRINSSGATEYVEESECAQQLQAKASTSRGALKGEGEGRRAKRKRETAVAEEAKVSESARHEQEQALKSCGAAEEGEKCKRAQQFPANASKSSGALKGAEECKRAKRAKKNELVEGTLSGAAKVEECDRAQQMQRTPMETSGVPEEADDSERFFIVQGPLHLGLKLRVGVAYSKAELKQRCLGCVEKLEKLESHMQDPSKLSPCDLPGKKNVMQVSQQGCRQGLLDIDGDASSSAYSALPSSPAVAEKTSSGGRGRLRRVAANTAARPPAVVARTAAPDADLARTTCTAPETGDGLDERSEEGLEVPSSVPSRQMMAAGPYGFTSGQVVWYCDPRRPPWPAQIIGSSDHPSTFRIRLLSQDEQECQRSDARDTPEGPRSCLANVAQLLPFVSGDADAVARVAKIAEAAHAQQACFSERRSSLRRARLKMK